MLYSFALHRWCVEPAQLKNRTLVSLPNLRQPTNH